MKKEMSNKITNINFILTILIVLLHSNCIVYANTTAKSYEAIKMINSFLTTICGIAVPTFFAISTILFFRNFEMKKYKEKIKKRINTLVIPYLFFSIVFLIYVIIFTHIPFVSNMSTTMAPIKYDFISLIKYILLSEFNGPAWYMRDLFIFFLFSPIVYFLVKSLKKLNWVLLGVIFIVTLLWEPSYYSCFYWLFLYYFVSYITINNKFETIWNNLKKWRYCLLIIGLILFFMLGFGSENTKIYYIFRMTFPLIFFLYIYKNKFLEKKPSTYAKYSFIIYCTHYNIAISLKRIFILFFGQNPILILFFQALTCAFTIFLVIVITKILSKCFPNFTKKVLGGRI